MGIKKISLELDAYERLKRAKRGKESFSSVVRWARFDAPESTGVAILEETQALYGAKKGAPKKAFDYWERVEAKEADKPRVSPSRWDSDQ